MEELLKKTKELIGILKRRPKLLIKGDVHSIISYITFFEGFFLSLKIFNNIDIEREISKWYQTQVDIKAPNMYWFAQFELLNSNKSESEKIEELLSNIEIFFNENIEIFNGRVP